MVNPNGDYHASDRVSAEGESIGKPTLNERNQQTERSRVGYFVPELLSEE